MKINEQLQILMNQAPQHGVSLTVMETSIVPALKRFAKDLQHSHYYVLRSRERDWIVTTLSHRQQPQRQKRVIYAFATRQDAYRFENTVDSEVDILSVPVTHLLFDLFACDRIDSMVFMETSGNLERGKEISRASLQNLIQQQLKQLNSFHPQKTKNIPSNFA